LDLLFLVYILGILVNHTSTFTPIRQGVDKTFTEEQVRAVEFGAISFAYEAIRLSDIHRNAGLPSLAEEVSSLC